MSIGDNKMMANDAGIIHIGPGQFHRAHQASYINELMKLDKADGWGICGCGLFPGDRKIKAELEDQNYSYLHILKSKDDVKIERIKSLVNYIHGGDDPENAISMLANEKTKIVTLTITLNGYDVISINDEPSSFSLFNKPLNCFDLIVRALEIRKEKGIVPFTLLSCDNVPANGAKTKEVVLKYCKNYNQELAQWIENNVEFPSSMVDRITPALSEDDVAYLRDEYAIVDNIPVSSEPYTRWVIEDRFTAGRPNLELVGVEFVENVEKYELLKIRMLNASHQISGFAGMLSGYKYIHEAMENPRIFELVKLFLMTESKNALGDIFDKLDGTAYCNSILERFSNPALFDTTSRLCSDSTIRIPKLIVPIINANNQDSRSCLIASAVVAFWYFDLLENNYAFTSDPIQEKVLEALSQSEADPIKFLSLLDDFKPLLENDFFVSNFSELVCQLNLKNFDNLMELIIDKKTN